MTPDQTVAVEQSKGPPKGATHEYGGAYYLERDDGQFLIYDPREGGWGMAEAVNRSMALTEKLRPIPEPFMAPEERAFWYGEPTPEEDEAWAEKEARQSDPVNHPDHYTQGGIECIDAIQASMSPDEFAGYLKGNCQKYIWRYRQKGGAQDLAKARWYLERLENLAR